ncbi:hypothetical protein HYC85_028010 [Camellia sinensis]|uniref:SWIM-type domain-containing protein n=1 Tax=Camellia sinensis TaxID=4442 RepID=A0A7J7FU76_CAMSI|nr:hypothetical protein HYC85_028010 [Camellia sinensis]
MLLLGKSIGVERIDVVVEQKSGTDRNGSLANPCIEDEDQTNLLRRYCAHSEKSPKSNQFFYLKRWTKIHSCGADVRTSKNPRLSSDLVSNVVSERVRDRPLTRPTDVAYTFKADYGPDISYHIAWLGVEKVREAMHCDYLTSFDQLRWYGDAVQHYNPGSHINIDYDLKTTFAIVDSEGESNWSWFLYELSKVIADDRRMTFVSDRNIGLLEAMPKAFPSAYHGWCLQHLKNNFRDKLKGMENGFKEHLIRKLGDCAYEPTVTGFHALLEELKSEGKQRAYNFLSRGQRYGEMTSNAAKSFKNWIKEARNLPITKLVDTIRNQIMCQMSERRDIANKWNGIICPTFETNLQDSFNSSRSWNLSKANDDVFEVHSFPSVTVDVGRCVCSCYQWQINGFPYEHVVAAIQRNAYNLNNCVEKYFHVENYREAYAAVIFPIPSVEKPDFCSSDFIILPPIVKRPTGRPRKSRIPSQGEKDHSRMLQLIELSQQDKLPCPAQATFCGRRPFFPFGARFPGFFRSRRPCASVRDRLTTSVCPELRSTISLTKSCWSIGLQGKSRISNLPELGTHSKNNCKQRQTGASQGILRTRQPEHASFIIRSRFEAIPGLHANLLLS